MSASLLSIEGLQQLNAMRKGKLALWNYVILFFR